jgi:tRNA threonylcarbamoyladenosine modification (KEOPS) complex Cgi121 subunit
MNDKLLNEVAERVWHNKLKALGLEKGDNPFLGKTYQQVKDLAEAGDKFQQFVLSSHVEQVREVLTSLNQINAEKFAHSMENYVDRQAENS